MTTDHQWRINQQPWPLNDATAKVLDTMSTVRSYLAYKKVIHSEASLIEMTKLIFEVAHHMELTHETTHD